MSRLEKIIKLSKKVWKKNNIDPSLMDEMIDSMAQKTIIREGMDINIFTEEQVMKATRDYIERKQKIEEEKKLWEKPVT